MVKHIVMWKLKDDENKLANMKKMRELLTGLVGKIPGLRSAEVGFNFNPNGFDIVLYSELDSKEALELYQRHPKHLIVKQFVHSVIIDRVVTDYIV